MVGSLPDSFVDTAQVTRSHVPAANAPSRIQMDNQPVTELAPRAKRGRPVGSGDKQPRQRRTAPPAPTPQAPLPPMPTQPAISEENEEIAINYNTTGQIWDRNNTIMDECFALQISQQLEDKLPDPRTIKEAQSQPDWPQWETAINLELDSLISRQVFGPISQSDPGTHLTGYRWTS